MNKLEYIPSKKEKAFWVIAGFVLFLPTLGFTFRRYSFFFNRESYFTRKNLLDYLLLSQLPSPKKLSYVDAYVWELKNYRLYLWKDNSISLHKENKDCILCNYHDPKGADLKRFNKINRYILNIRCLSLEECLAKIKHKRKPFRVLLTYQF